MNGLLYRLQLFAFGMNSPKNAEKDARIDSKSLVTKYARGNVNLKRGSYITASKIEKQRELLSKCRF